MPDIDLPFTRAEYAGRLAKTRTAMAAVGVEGSLCKHGNPNVLTRDRGTSRIGQGPSAQTTLVEVERFEGEPPPVTAFEPPVIEERR